MTTDYVHVDVFSSLPYSGNSLAVCPDARGLSAMQNDGVVSRAFRESSAGRAENGLIVMFPGGCAASGDVYVKTGALKGHKSYVVKVSPWLSGNVALRHRQGVSSRYLTAKRGIPSRSWTKRTTCPISVRPPLDVSRPARWRRRASGPQRY